MSLDLSGAGSLHQQAIDAFDKFWNSIVDPNFQYFKRIRFGIVELVLYSPASRYREIHKAVFGTEATTDGPGLAVFAGSQKWTKEEFLEKGKLFVIVQATKVGDKIILRESVLAHEFLHLADWYSSMVQGLDFAEPDELNKNAYYKAV